MFPIFAKEGKKAKAAATTTTTTTTAATAATVTTTTTITATRRGHFRHLIVCTCPGFVHAQLPQSSGAAKAKA